MDIGFRPCRCTAIPNDGEIAESALGRARQPARSLVHLDRDFERLVAGAVALAAREGGAERIEADGDAHIGVGRAGAFRRIEADPADIGNKGFGPGVVALRRCAAAGAEVAGDVAGGNTEAAGCADEDVGRILGAAALAGKNFRCRRPGRSEEK